MRRSLGAVVAGWVTGFLIAIAWGATRANNARLASTLSLWAIVGMVVIALLLLSIAVTDLVERRRSARAADAKTTPAATDAADSERRAAARIAELEAMLAREQDELDAAAESLAASDLVTTSHVAAGTVEPDVDPAAAELEPVLRQEVVDAVAKLVGAAETGATPDLARELQALRGKTR